MQKDSVGLLEIQTGAGMVRRDDALIIDFGGYDQPAGVALNGVPIEAATPTALAEALERHRADESGNLLSVDYGVSVEASRLVIEPDAVPSAVFGGPGLRGAEARSAIERSRRVVRSMGESWPAAAGLDPDLERLEAELAPDGTWGGPLVVSMPRTGSTLMGTLFLFCRDAQSPSGNRFDRYLHEPVAPLFWEGAAQSAISEFVGERLSARDVIQESAYQFTHPAIARWFVQRARSPVVFTIRHPQLAWASRWRVMLSQMAATTPQGDDPAAARAAVAGGDFSEVGSLLTKARPPDNGFHSFIWMLQECMTAGIEFIIVDNTRFRDRPEETMRQISGALQIPFDRAMVDWKDLSSIRERIHLTELAAGTEYPWYYERTFASDRGILPETRSPLDLDRFPSELRGVGKEFLTIDEAVVWHRLLLSRPETLP